MAIIIQGASESVIAETYSYRDDDAVERVRRSYAEDDRLSTRFRERIRETHENLRSDRAYRLATSAMRRLRNVRREDRIEQLYDIGAMQHAKKRMRDVIMTSRLLKKARTRGMIDGYGDHIEWTEERSHEHASMLTRQLNNGLIEKHEDGVYRSTRYYLREERRTEFNNYDRAEAILTRRTVERLIRAGKGDDPTSPYNACLTAFYP
ncbi:MAG: hypothetical protein ACRDDY_13970 [Clostridium sp.]|uniref:hypothetical protein n=1 Tax=Clostridium sp. TaxID=1506 RepID=UPI003EE515CA